MQVVPSEPILRLFDEQIRVLSERVQQNNEEARTLAVLRDALLPKLISGEFSVPPIEMGTEVTCA